MDKSEIMRQKLASQIMKKSSISLDTWMNMSDKEIMELTQFPQKVRVSIIEHKKSGLSAKDLADKLVQNQIDATDIEAPANSGEVYDPEAPVIKILAEQVEVSAEAGIAKILYTRDELQAAINEVGENATWIIILKKVAASLDKERIDNELLTELAKEKAQSIKSKKK